MSALGVSLHGTRRMLPTSHGFPTEGQTPSPHLLAEAFSDFISASARLEISYRDLQAEVQHLGRELAERNLALNASLAENQAMRQSLEQILESLPCGVLVLRRDGEVRFANPEASRLLDLSLSQMRSLEEIEQRRGVDLSMGSEDLTSSSPEQELVLRGVPGERWLAVRRQKLRQQAMSTTRSGADAILILRDVSARRRSESERDAARSAVALAEVSAILAHEIRNPLASLELFASLLEDCPERLGEWVSHLRAGIRSLSGTVNNVLALHGGAAPVMARLELVRELEMAVDFVRPLATQADVTLTLAPSTDPVVLHGNRSALQQLILNLCSNALRHTPAGGEIRISLRLERGLILVAVEDNGQGISVEHQQQLFYSRFSGSGSTSGLGLAVCSRLMQQHGGAIRVQSEPGKGSIFTLEFAAL